MKTPRWFRRRSGPERSRVLSWRHRCGVRCVAAAPDGRLYLGTEAGELWCWRPGQQAPELLDGTGRSPLTWLAANADHAACAWADGRTAVWIDGGLRDLDGPCDPRQLIALIAWTEGAFLWIGATGTVCASRGETWYPAVLPLRDPLRCAAADPHNGRVLLGGADGRLVLWVPRTKPELEVVRLPAAAVLLAAGPGDHVLALDAAGDVHHVHAGRFSTLPPAGRETTALAVLPDGVLVTGHRLTWRGGEPSGEVIARTPHGERRLATHRDTVLSLEALPNGSLAAAGADGLVVVWDLASDRCRVVSRHDGPATLPAALPRGIVSASGQTVRLWLPPAEAEQPPAVREMLSRPWAVLPDGTRAAFDEKATLKILDDAGTVTSSIDATLARLCREPQLAVACGLPALSFLRQSEGVLALAYLGDAGVAVAFASGRIAVVRRSLPELVLPLPEALGRVNCLAGGNTGPEWCVVAGSATGQVILWWLSGDVECLPLRRHAAAVLAVAVLSDGRVASAAADGALWVCDPARQAPDMVYTTEEPVVSLAFDEPSFVLSCGLSSGAVLRLGIEPEHSRRQVPRAPAPNHLLDPPSTVILRPPGAGAAEREEIYPHHTRVRRLDLAPRWTTWRTRTPDGRSYAVRLVSLGGVRFDLDVVHRYRRLTAGLPHSVAIEHLDRRGDSLAILTAAPTETLRERFAGRPPDRRGLPRQELLGWLGAVAEGLDDLWQRHGLSHLDVSATNVWIDEGRARLCGWGLVPAGLPSSASLPAGERDGAADQHCLARTYHHLLTGRSLTDDPELTGLHPAERPAIRRALDADPARRFASCRSLIAELRKAAGAIVEPDAPTTERVGAEGGRSQGVFVGGADDATEEQETLTAVLRRWRPALSRAGLALDVVRRGACVRPSPESLTSAALAVFFVTDRAGLPLDDRDAPADTFGHDLSRLPSSARVRVYFRETPPPAAPRGATVHYSSLEQLTRLLEDDLQALTGLSAAPPEGDLPPASTLSVQPFLRGLVDQHRTLELPGLRRAGLRAVALDQVYVALRGDRTSVFERVQERDLLLAQADELSTTGEEDRRRTRGRFLRDNPTMLTLAERDRPQPGQTLNLADAFAAERCLVLLGDPGSGKTTLLRWLTLRLGEALLSGSPDVVVPRRCVDPDGPDEGAVSLGPARLPLLLRAADYADALADGPLSIDDYLARQFDDNLSGAIRAHLRAGKAVVLLDGLDEIGANSARREDVLRAVEAFVDDWVAPGRLARGNRIVLTSRIAGYHAAPLTSTCAAHYTIEPMARPAVERFLGGWAEAAGAPADEVRALKDAIFDPNTPGVAELASNPLLVTILALVYRTKRGLPPRRVELYEEAIRALVEGWPDVPPGDLEPLADVLGPVAWHVHEHYPTGLIEQAELIELLRDAQQAVSSPNAWRMRPEELVAALRENVGLLAARGDALFGFLHLTFQEFFVAWQLIRDRAAAAAQILDRLAEPRWREPILLALGLASRRWPAPAFHELLGKLLDDDPARRAPQLPGAARALAEALPDVGELPRAVVRRVAARLLAPFTAPDTLDRFPSLRSRLEASLLRLRRSAPQASEDALCEALADPARAAATAALVQKQTWYSPRVAEALLDALPYDDARDWPVASCLLELASPQVPPRPLASPETAGDLARKKKHEAEAIRSRQQVLSRIYPILKLREELRQRAAPPLASLSFRAALLAEPRLEDAARAHVGWLSLIGSTCGGYADHQAGAIASERARLAAFQTLPDAVRQARIDQQPEEFLARFGAADPVLEVARYLDDKMAGREAHARAAATFSASAIWRDAPAALTARLLGALRAGGAPDDVRDELWDLWHDGDAETRAAALTGLAALGDEGVIEELDSAFDDPPRRDFARRALARMAQSAHGLRDAAARSAWLVLRAAGALGHDPGQGREIAAALLRVVSRAADVPPDLTPIAAEASAPLRGALAADAWHRLARGWGIDDPVFAANTLAESVTGSALVEMLSQAHLAPARRADPDAWPVEPIPPLSDAPGVPLAAVEALAALRISSIPPEQEASLRETLRRKLLATFAGRADVELELRALASPSTVTREEVRALADPYRRARVLLRLLDADPEETLLEEARSTARAIADPLARGRVRERLLRFCPAERLADEVASLAADARSIADADERCRAFARLAARADEPARAALNSEALAAATLIRDPRHRASTLALLPASARPDELRAVLTDAWQRARARELEGLLLARSANATLAAHVAAAPEAWAAVLAFAALSDLVAYWRDGADAEDDWAGLTTAKQTDAIRNLIDRGEERGLTLTPDAGRALATLLASQSAAADEAAVTLLPLMQAPAGESWTMPGWRSHSDVRLRQHAGLMRAEPSRRIDETTIPALAALLGGGPDRSRLRAQLVLWSDIVAVEKKRRGLLVSRLGRRALDRLAAEHAALRERGEVAAARGLYKFWGDVSHDDPAALTAWADQAARPGRESAQALWVLANVEDLTPDAWPAFRRLLGEARPLPVRKALLRSLCALAFLEGRLPQSEWQAMQPELDRFRREDWSGQRALLSPEGTIVESLRAARPAQRGQRARLAEEALAGVTETFTELLVRQDDFLRTLRRLGERFYQPLHDDSRAERVAAEVEQDPALFAVLLDWLLESLAGAPDDPDGWHPKIDWLLRIAAPAAERMPAAFLRLTAADAPRWRTLLARAVRRQDGAYARRAAVVLLGCLREATPAVAAALGDALRDAPVVQTAAVRAAERFTQVEALDAFAAMLNDDSALTAYGAARVLSALGRSDRRPAAQRRRIVAALVDALGRPLAWRSTYRLLGRGTEQEPARIVRGVRLERALHQALLEVGGWA